MDKTTENQYQGFMSKATQGSHQKPQGDVYDTLARIPMDQWGGDEDAKKYTAMAISQRAHHMFRGSLFADQNAKYAHFNDFKAETVEQADVLGRVVEIAKRITSDEKFNTVFTGGAGVGKTFSAVCILNHLQARNEMPPYSCLFVSVPALFDIELQKARGDREFIEKANTMEKRISAADVVVFDDFGSETSMRQGVTEASDFIQKTWFRIADVRNGRTNIFTTNNTLADLAKIYNPKLVSRMLTADSKNIISFSGIADRRIS